MTSYFRNRNLWTLIFIWAVWAVIIIGYQSFVDARIHPQRPDYARPWTGDNTTADINEGKPYLNNPFMNRQVEWDSEYYLSIAIAGYEDQSGNFVRMPSGSRLYLNYAFFPLYPHVMRVVAVPLSVFGMDAIATATLAGVIISLLGTLAGMISLYSIAQPQLEASGAIRTAFYMLIFPTGFFLTHVYTEGLFVGLAFTSLALIQKKRLLLAGILAAFAVWTRAVGLALVVPLALAWLSHISWGELRNDWKSALRPYKTLFLNTIAVLLPLIAYALWNHYLGKPFNEVEDRYFGRGLFDWNATFRGFEAAWNAIISGENLQARAYNLLEFGGILLALTACLFTLKQYPKVALFGLLALAVSVFSGEPQSLIRYVLVIPSIYLFLARLGKYIAFDRAWTLLSVLLLGLLTYLITFDLWVA